MGKRILHQGETGQSLDLVFVLFVGLGVLFAFLISQFLIFEFVIDPSISADQRISVFVALCLSMIFAAGCVIAVLYFLGQGSVDPPNAAAKVSHEQTLSKAFMQLILESLPDALIIKDEHSKILLANRAFINTYPGEMHDKIIGHTTFSSFDKEIADGFLASDQLALKEGFADTQFSLTDPNGCLKSYQSNKVRFDGVDGQKFILAVWRDVTEQREAEQQLIASEERYEVAVRGSSIGVWDYDVASAEFYLSPQFKDILGMVRNEYRPSFDEFEARIHPDHREGVVGAFNDHLWGDIPYDIEYRFRCMDDKYVWLHARGQAVRDENGDAIRMAGSVDDISEKKAAEAALKGSRGFLELIFENNPDLIFVKDEKFRLVQVNQAFKGLYPKDMRDDLIGKTTFEKYDEKEVEVFLKQDKKAFAEGYSAVTEKVTPPDGQPVRHFFSQKVLFENELGEKFILCIARDVSEREGLIEKLSNSNEQLERFAYVASHDLQEPLRTIASYCDLLRRRYSDKLDKDGLEFIEFAIDGAERMRRLIEDVLAYSRIDQDTVELEEIDLNEVLDEVRVDLERLIVDRGAVITSHDLPHVKAKNMQIKAVIQNLVQNGLKFNASDKPTIDVRFETEDQFYVFSVSDNGIGIDDKYSDQIFEVFTRLHPADVYSGTGVGLAICRKIIEQHGGKIWLEKSEGREGSTISFSLPIR